MHKLLLYINTDIFLPTRRGKKPTEENDNSLSCRGTAEQQLWLWSISRNVLFLFTGQLRSSGSHRSDLMTWAGESFRTAGRSSSFLLHCFQNLQLLKRWLVWHQNPPWKVLPAVKQEVQSFKLFLPPVWARVMCSETPAVRGNVTCTFLSFLREVERTLQPWQQRTKDGQRWRHFRLSR